MNQIILRIKQSANRLDGPKAPNDYVALQRMLCIYWFPAPNLIYFILDLFKMEGRYKSILEKDPLIKGTPRCLVKFLMCNVPQPLYYGNNYS